MFFNLFYFLEEYQRRNLLVYYFILKNFIQFWDLINFLEIIYGKLNFKNMYVSRFMMMKIIKVYVYRKYVYIWKNIFDILGNKEVNERVS